MRKMYIIFSFLWFLPLSAEPTLWDFIYGVWAEARLIRAAKTGNLSDVQYYLSQGCNINESDFFYITPLKAAVLNDQWMVTKYLLQNGALISNSVGSSELAMALRHKKIHTPFVIMLWHGKNEIKSHKNEALEEINKNDDFFSAQGLRSMISDFEGFVTKNKNQLPQELQKEIEEYKKKVPQYEYRHEYIGLATVTMKIENYKFD